jgi:hypothetical protein
MATIVLRNQTLRKQILGKDSRRKNHIGIHYNKAKAKDVLSGSFIQKMKQMSGLKETKDSFTDKGAAMKLPNVSEPRTEKNSESENLSRFPNRWMH